ncbi:uncharacterized protein LOC106760514 [Vigna radiata var. radiata]|uniref:Uncharacterized protein LOC106760514 n=1 Tax=Vigna radiata var. radiata TaxID=3916 RepID=A0A1S3U090_VIGRR|nr:uncharacterized protein LOC106760514 [Vigna radiata var. radiata]
MIVNIDRSCLHDCGSHYDVANQDAGKEVTDVGRPVKPEMGVREQERLVTLEGSLLQVEGSLPPWKAHRRRRLAAPVCRKMERMDDLRNALLEFLIRSPFRDTEEKESMVKHMLQVYSKSDNDSGFKKTFLLKIIQNDLLSSHSISISDNHLKILDYLEELFLRDAVPVPATISAAYCAVAVECTVKYLRLNLPHNLFYLRAVKRIWRLSTAHMREGSLLFSVELEEWRNYIETSLLDSQVKELLASMDTRGSAIIKLRAFFDEACKGSPFAPLTATEHTATEHTATQHTATQHTIEAQGSEEGVEKIGEALEDSEKTFFSWSSDINDDEVEQVENAAGVDERDLEDNLEVGTSRFNLASPKKKKLSPLKIYKPVTIRRRRTTKKWNRLEEETLKNGVETFGRGKWKLILNAHKDIFGERTEVDLKDKWRNMMVYGCK